MQYLHSVSVRPLNDRVMVKPIIKDISEGGIILPHADRPQTGKVISIGPGKRDEEGNRQPPDVQPGDTIVFPKFAGTEIKVDGKEYILIAEGSILGVLD